MTTGRETIAELLHSLQMNARPEKIKTLERIDQICQAFIATKQEISRADIGHHLHQEGVLGRRTLYSTQSADYRSLIEAWRQFQEASKGPKGERPPAELLSPSWIGAMPNPVHRQLARKLVHDLRRVTAELKSMKTMFGPLVVDMRPSAGPNSKSGQAAGFSKLLPQEIDALAAAISKPFLDAEGWKRGPSGAIVTSKGSPVFRPGFVTAVEKVIAEVLPTDSEWRKP